MNNFFVRFSVPVSSYQVPNILIPFVFPGPPKFTEKRFNYHVVSAEQPVELMFQLQTHSREIAGCHVTKYPGRKPDVEGKLSVDDHSLTEECLR